MNASASAAYINDGLTLGILVLALVVALVFAVIIASHLLPLPTGEILSFYSSLAYAPLLSTFYSYSVHVCFKGWPFNQRVNNQ